MSDVLRIEKDGEVIWEGEITSSGIMFDSKMMIKPIYSETKWFELSTDDPIKDTAFKTEQFKYMTLRFESLPVVKYEGQFPNAITQAAYEKAMEEYEMATVPPPTDEEVAEALEKAADLFITEGWAQGGYHVSKTAAMAQSHGVVPTAYFIEKEEEEG